jgi:uncharacterized protein (DUF433 family)
VPPVEDVLARDERKEWCDVVVTDAELRAWEEHALGRKGSAEEPLLRLIGEVRRLRAALRGVDQSTRIVRDPERCAGDPSLEGTRTAVHDVVSYAKAFEGDLERVRDEALPHLSMKQVRAAMAYYDQHTDEIEEILQRRREDFASLPEAPVRR